MMTSIGMYVLGFVLVGIGLCCVWLLIQFSKKLGSIKGERATEELEDLDKMRGELLDTIHELREEVAELKRKLDEHNRKKD